MTTKGAFYVKNNSSDKITGYVRPKDSPEVEVRFDLNTGEQSESASFESGAATHDSWYYSFKKAGETYTGTSPVHTMQKTKIKAPSLWKSLMII
ncbi:hypothetical protein [Vibrio diabolicus]|uniref:hypothetical protein n=1 Tax=Vibrio diabolicus TaxID=50719 RepID=UPI00375323C0